jgi:hypothetical protein
VAIGYQAMMGTTIGNSNVAIGYGACIDMGVTFGHNNVFIGKDAAGGTWTGEQSDNNVAIGFESMKAAMNNTTYNTCVGSTAGTGITGDGNTCIGYAAGDNISTGINNTCIGNSARTGASEANNVTAIGKGTSAQAVDNTVTLGNQYVTQIHMSQDSDAVMYADGTINTSDIRWKKNIEDSDLGLSFINSVRPVKYNFKSDKQGSKSRYGVVAQEIIEVLEAIDKEDFAGIETDNPERLGADYIQFVAPLIKAVQELSAKVEALEAQVSGSS